MLAAVDGLMLDRLGDGGYDLGARAKQIRDGLYEREHFTPAAMLELQLDDRALFLNRWRELLDQTLNRAEAAPWRTEMQQGLRDWDGRASTASVSYRLVRAFRQEVIQRALEGFEAAVRQRDPAFVMPILNQAEHPVWMLIERRPPHLLPSLYADWEALLGAARQECGEAYATATGWHRLHGIGENTIRQASATPSVRRYPHPSLTGWICQRLSCLGTVRCQGCNRPTSVLPTASRCHRAAKSRAILKCPAVRAAIPSPPITAVGTRAGLMAKRPRFSQARPSKPSTSDQAKRPNDAAQIPFLAIICREICHESNSAACLIPAPRLSSARKAQTGRGPSPPIR